MKLFFTEWATKQQLKRHYFTNNNSTSCNNITTPTSNFTNSYENHDISISKPKQYDIYLGGTSHNNSNETSPWRETLAIPVILQKGLTYKSSQFSEVNRSLCCDTNISDDENTILENIKAKVNVEYDLDQEIRLIEDSNVLLFVISSKTRSISSMLLAAHCIGLHKYQIVLCVQKLAENVNRMGNEELSHYAVKDFNRCRTYLADIAKREGIPVFECITEAIQSAIDIRLQQK